MTVEEARALLSRTLREVAPEADVAAADPDGPLQDELGLDSLDFIRIVDLVHDTTGIDIPERDFPRLSTLRSFVAYLASEGRVP